MNEQEPTITYHRIGQQLVVPQYLIDLYDKPHTETAEQRGERIARINAAWALLDAALPALAAITDPISRAVLDLHANTDGDCYGCDIAGYDAEYPEWPCPTTRLIAEEHGIELPDEIPRYRPTIGPDPEPRSFRDVINGAMVAAMSFGFKSFEETP